jgi:hypothetical protein
MGNEASTQKQALANNAGHTPTNHALIKSIKRVGAVYSANIKCVLLGCSGKGYKGLHIDFSVSHSLFIVGVGKTSFKSRFLWDEFKDAQDPTMGAIRHMITRVVGQTKLNIELWVCIPVHDCWLLFLTALQDTGSVERYNSFVPMYLKDCACAIIFYDITDKDTFLKAVNLTKNVQTNAPEGTFIMLAGNKGILYER